MVRKHFEIKYMLPRLHRLFKRALRVYANWRVGALPSETYNSSDSIVLTFDDYGTAEQVGRLLDVMSKLGVRSVFFLNGDWAHRNSEIVLKIAQAGHLIGNHTYSHADLLTLTDEEVRAEIADGVPSVWLRPPRGRYDARVRKIAWALGQSIKYWSIDSDDWQGVSADYMVTKILGEIHPGAVILFHIHAKHTAEALPALIREIRKQGYRLSGFGEPIWGQQ